ncbi:MAG: glycosyltransferase [Anaerolineaceae bacterium]|nr:glycosyltransferase [Anaerolineaceae bacterium]
MHILEVIDGLTAGGAEKMVLTLSRLLAERQIPVSVVSFDPDWDTPYAVELRKLGVPVHHLTGKLFNLCRIERLTRLIKESRVEVVHTYLSYANIVGTIASKIAGVPVITSLRSISMEPYHPVRARIETWLMRYASDMVMANGYSVAQAHQVRLGGKKIHVIQNAVSVYPQPSQDERNAIKKELIGDAERPLLMSVGRLSPPKGFDTLLEAFSEVCVRYPQAALALVGDGELHSFLVETIARLNLQNSVFLLGERNDIMRILPAADIYVSSSHWEGMSVAILEAMSAGLPVIATKVGDAQWVLSDQTGLLVAPRISQELSAAVIKLLEDKALRLQYGQMSRKRIETDYNVDNWCRRMLELYAQVTPQLRPTYA